MIRSSSANHNIFCIRQSSGQSNVSNINRIHQIEWLMKGEDWKNAVEWLKEYLCKLTTAILLYAYPWAFINKCQINFHFLLLGMLKVDLTKCIIIKYCVSACDDCNVNKVFRWNKNGSAPMELKCEKKNDFFVTNN